MTALKAVLHFLHLFKNTVLSQSSMKNRLKNI